MGINYYVRYNICKKCNRFDELHLGKRSVGWKFTFQSIEQAIDDERNIIITSFREWKEFINKRKAYIVDEYKRKISLDKFSEIVKESMKEKNDIVSFCRKSHTSDESYYDKQGYCMQPREFS